MQKLMPMNMFAVIAHGFRKSLFLPSRSGPSSSYTAQHHGAVRLRVKHQSALDASVSDLRTNLSQKRGDGAEQEKACNADIQ